MSTITVPLYDLVANNRPHLEEFHEALERVEESGQYILGPFVEKFEKELAKFCGVKHAIGVGSGTDAILISLMALDIGPGDEVITSPFAYIHTAGCIRRRNATPVFCDIDPISFNMDPAKVEAAITPRTKAILVVHLYGQTCDMGPILALAKKRGIAVIEDADQALGAKYKGKQAGALGSVGVTSFYPTKGLSAMGDAGAVMTNDDALAARIRLMRVHGIEEGYVVRQLGGNFRLDALHAALLSIKLPHADADTKDRRAHAERYERRLEELQVSTPTESENCFHTFSHYAIRVRGGGRDPLSAHLAANGVESRVYYPIPLHLQPFFADLGHKAGDFPHAEAAAQETLCLPVFPEMTKAQQDLVIEGIREYFMAE